MWTNIEDLCLSAFGLGTVIYDGLEFGAFLEKPRDSPCFLMLKGVNPILHATFAFLQMYFIFVSARVRKHVICKKNWFQGDWCLSFVRASVKHS